jgi:hypothetical protein
MGEKKDLFSTWTEAKKGENISGWTNMENQKATETLLKLKPEAKLGDFFKQ